MKKILTCVVLLVAVSCTRPSTSYSFNDLVWAVSDGLREYEEWVAAENDDFPNLLCLAGVHFTASLAEQRSQSGSIGLPLAAPASGLTGMLGYQFIATQSEAGLIQTALLAKYQTPDIKHKKDGDTAVQEFVSNINQKYQKDGIAGRNRIEEPSSTDNRRGPFASRTDLAAELWRIRQALHTAVLSSPTETGGYVMEPQPMTMVLNYTLTRGDSVRATVNMGPQKSASLGGGQSVTENNRIILVYLTNTANDRMSCNSRSIEKAKFDAAITEALKLGTPSAGKIPEVK